MNLRRSKQVWFVLAGAMTLCISLYSCQNSNQTTLKMVGGEILSSEDRLYDVIVKVGSWCSGTMIATNWVLTAAHCLDGFSDESFSINHRGKDFNSKRIVIHPEYSQDDIRSRNDIALIELEDHVNLINGPIKLVVNTLTGKKQALIAGFGIDGSLKYFQLKSEIEKLCLEVADAKLRKTEKAKSFLKDYRRRIRLEETALIELKEVVNKFKYQGTEDYPHQEIELASYKYREERDNRHFWEFNSHFADILASNDRLMQLKEQFYSTDPRGSSDGKAKSLKVIARELTDQYLVFRSNDDLSGSCQGDSGGPMVVEVGGVLKQVGVAHGYNLEDYRSAIDICGGTGIYTSVLYFTDFIKRYINPH